MNRKISIEFCCRKLVEKTSINVVIRECNWRNFSNFNWIEKNEILFDVFRCVQFSCVWNAQRDRLKCCDNDESCFSWCFKCRRQCARLWNSIWWWFDLFWIDQVQTNMCVIACDLIMNWFCCFNFRRWIVFFVFERRFEFESQMLLFDFKLKWRFAIDEN